MPNILKQIIKVVETAASPKEALPLLTKRVRKALSGDAVSLYLFSEENKAYILASSDGLTEKAKQGSFVSKDFGLISLVGRREEPIHIENAPTHPEYREKQLVGAENMKAFLGVPIIQNRVLYGVLVAFKEDARAFEDAEEALLTTLAIQLSGFFSEIEASGELSSIIGQLIDPNRLEDIRNVVLTGLGSVQGVGIGSAVVHYPTADVDFVSRQLIENIEEEKTRFFEALDAVREEMERLSRRMKTMVSQDEQALFDVYIRILDRDNLGSEVTTIIEKENLSAESALSFIIKKHVQLFENMDDAYLSERASDFRDLGRRVLSKLIRTRSEEVEYPKRTILVGEEITASLLAEVPEGRLHGIVSVRGAHNSHVAILARALNIPTVMGVKGLSLETLHERALIVDGYGGKVYVSPQKAILAQFKKWKKEEKELNVSLESLRDKPAETEDNHPISLQVNTGLAMDASLSLSVGAEGVGLYRSEVPFMTRDRFPSEDEQYIIYRQILKSFSPQTVTMRTLDVGGDKVLSYFPVTEENPYLGWRGIRLTLDHPDIFLIQVRAMLRASEELDNLRIMLPMITTLKEVEEAELLLDQAFLELIEEGYQIKKPKRGVMIEVPAAVFLAKQLAKRVDFISVGSNDLAQYLLAVDRNNPQVANLYDPFHPAMLRTLLKIVEEGHAGGIEVSICGEMAADPLAVILLVAMGFDTLSMNSASLLKVKWVIRHITIAMARKALSDVLEMDHSEDIRSYLQKTLEAHGLGSLTRAGKR